ncbi:helix-turn-helix domain-containing protein [Tepidibacter hydrothermalis]|uniref:Helix-turn-helix transcriptional regulator n=1 Tax=Tepidibacter hydrothermalis TaxID=3036126 RepID=A0ABY8EAW9_9FIRM|nr:helix-turn-helix transcriptional regulator [Tepidibacter hydrothermalis]WFD09040.1 helix-turn-helix transcriptional regulator [Tepidibacter hydrothermalis]
MIGIKYICKEFHVQLKDIGEELGVSKQTVNSWVSGSRKIPDKHLNILSEIFELPKEYFQKKLNEEDKVIIQDMKLEKYIQSILIDDIDEDESDLRHNFNSISMYKNLNSKIKAIETLRKIRNQLLDYEFMKNKNSNKERAKVEEILDIYTSFHSILNCEQVEIGLIKKIISIILDRYDIETENNKLGDKPFEQNKYYKELKELFGTEML